MLLKSFAMTEIVPIQTPSSVVQQMAIAAHTHVQTGIILSLVQLPHVTYGNVVMLTETHAAIRLRDATQCPVQRQRMS
jgi:hypothetical protein